METSGMIPGVSSDSSLAPPELNSQITLPLYQPLHFFEMLVNMFQTTQHHITEGSALNISFSPL
jgi:hypothetical protein